jgi:hypothetical protein
MNDHGTMTVELCDTNETRHVCEYATPELGRRLASLPSGAELRLAMSRIGVRANVWRAMAVVDDPSAEAAKFGPGERMRQPL